MTTTPEIQAVLDQYSRRQDRGEHPDGTFDKARRWYPSETERQLCCTVRSPSRNWPFSLMVHCRTLTHVAHLHGVAPKAARSALAKLIAHQRPAKTAPSGLCFVCGASWDCEHQVITDRGNLEPTPLITMNSEQKRLAMIAMGISDEPF